MLSQRFCGPGGMIQQQERPRRQISEAAGEPWDRQWQKLGLFGLENASCYSQASFMLSIGSITVSVTYRTFEDVQMFGSRFLPGPERINPMVE